MNLRLHHDSGNAHGTYWRQFGLAQLTRIYRIWEHVVIVFFSETMPADSTQTAKTILTADVQAIISAAERLSGAVTMRKKQINVLLSSCRELLNQAAAQNNVQDDLKEVGLPRDSGVDCLKPYVPSRLLHSQSLLLRPSSACDSSKGVIDALTQKGFLWCIVNAEKIENQVEAAQEKLLGSYEALEVGYKTPSH